MQRNLNTIIAILLVLSFVNSLFFYELSFPELEESSIVQENKISSSNPISKVDSIQLGYKGKPTGVLSSVLIEGDYALGGFFTHNEFVNLDNDGSAYVLENYESMKNNAPSTITTTFLMDETEPQTWPDLVDTYYPLSNQYYPYTNSSMFSPVFSEATNIKGKIHVLSHISTYYFDSVDFTIRVKVSIFNPTTGNLTEIASHEEILPHGMSMSNKKVFELTLNDTYTIPSGNRLKLSFEGKVSDLSAWAEVELISSHKSGGQYTWDISDGVYSNSYGFSAYDRILGMQIYYKSATYPEIEVVGVTNSSYYYEERDIQITVSGAISSSYRWNLDSYTPFSDTCNTTLPTTEGWHYLEVRANDGYNNTAIEVYDVGYDPTESYLILNNPSNNTIIESTSFLDFTTFGANNLTAEWDENGTIIDLLTLPGNNLSVPFNEGYHDLSVCLNDTFFTEYFFYRFGIDSSAPIISLNNVVNDTIQAAGKLIEVNITDFSQGLDIYYKWDDNIFLPWSPSEGTIYRTYLPESEGYHNLTVTAEDVFSHFSSEYFRFNVSSGALLVELRNMLNESWYQGGDVIEVTVSGTNGTLLFKWNEDAFQNGNPLLVGGQILTLDGINALSTDSSRIHYLTIIVGSIDHQEHTYVFEFRIDQESPNIDSSILDYDGERFKNSDVLNLILSDNATLTVDLYVLISIDGLGNITLTSPFEIDLSSLLDGYHNLTLFVFDIAENYATHFISFTVDSTSPIISIISFDGLITLSDNSKFAPYNSSIQISIIEDDSSLESTYSWAGSEYLPFTDIIILDYSDGYGILVINASDSLGNEEIIIYELTIDSQAPEITLTFPYEFSSINEYTSLLFNAADVSQKTIEFIEFYWDALPGFSPEIVTDSSGDFEVNLLPLYSTGETATLAIFAKDVVGNNNTYLFNFEIDFTPPESTLYVFDDDLGEYVNASTYDYLEVGSELWYDNTTTPDLSIFIYYWNNDTGEILNDPWLIQVPTLVGLHNLTIILRDDTGEGTSPNEIELVLSFIIKKEGHLTILETSENSCVYGENITITINLIDELFNELEITKIYANGSLMNFWKLSGFNCQFDFPSIFVDSKGNFTLKILAESEFYFGSTNESYSFTITVEPIPLTLSISVSDLEIIEGSSVVITGTLTFVNGTPIVGYEIFFFIYVYYKSSQGTVNALIDGYDEYVTKSDLTSSDGVASVDFLLSAEIDQIAIAATFNGSEILGDVHFEYEEIVKTIKAGLSLALLYSIIGGGIILLALVAFVVYRATKKKPFEKYLDSVETQDLMMRLNEICPGVVLSIFEQRKGPIPLISDHSFDYDYGGIFTVGTENFLLKICDQSYSALGFEDVHQGRKISAINLPNEGLIGFVHAIQIEKETARGGFENLSIIMLTQADFGNYLLSFSEYIYGEIDELISRLKSENPLAEVKEQIYAIRQRTAQVILAAIAETK
jgi:hypothetical protein